MIAGLPYDAEVEWVHAEGGAYFSGDVSGAIPVRFTNALGQSEGAMYDRVSRKLFRNAGTGTFTIGPDVATPVMGLHFMPRPKYTARDYVQDGLIALYDEGVQLISNTTFDVCVNSAQTEWTAEAYVDPGAFGGWWIANWRTGSYGIYFTVAGAGYPLNGMYNGSTAYYRENGSNIMNTRDSTKPWQMSTVANGNGGGQIYMAGTLWKNYVEWTNEGIVQNFKSKDISFAGTVAEGAKLRNFRLYDRALTAAEIAYNSSIDYARFNLP